MPRRFVSQVIVAAVLIAGLGGSGLRAQEAAAPAPREMLADQLVVLAQRMLTGRGEPTVEQLALARTLYDQALTLHDADAELWRVRSELAQRMGDTKGALVALGRYCNLAPADDAAQLRLILGKLDQFQTLDQRVTAAERLLDSPGAQSLTPALRSRLASYAAAGMREWGDMTRFGQRLREASELDPTNADAARMIRDLVAQRGGVVEMGVALVGLMRAEPVNPEVRRELAGLLLSQQAFEAAAVQFQIAQNYGGLQADPRFYLDWVMALAAGGHHADALAMLQDLELVYAPPAASPPTTAPTTAPATQPAARAVPVLPLELEMARLVIRRARGDAAGTAQSLQALRVKLAKAGANGAGDSDEMRMLDALFSEAAPSPAAVEALLKNPIPEDAAARRIGGWTLFRAGRHEEAEAWFSPLVDRDPFAALGLSVVAAKTGRAELATAMGQRALALAPTEVPGLAAAMQLQSLKAELRPTPAGRTMLHALSRQPRGIVQPAPGQNGWVTMSIKPQSLDHGYLQPLTARLTLRNASDVSLALGAPGALPSQVLVLQGLSGANIDRVQFQPFVIDAGRRLRLDSREEMTIDVRLDRGEMGLVLAGAPVPMLSLNFKAVLDPRTARNGDVVPGPAGAVDHIYRLDRAGMALTTEHVDRAMRSLQGGSVSEQMRALPYLMLVASSLGQQSSAKELADRVTEQTLNWTRGADVVGQAWVARFAPPMRDPASPIARLHEWLLRSDKPLVQLAYLMAQVGDPKSPVLDAAMRSPDRGVSDFAATLRKHLEYARQQQQATSPAKPAPGTPGTPGTPATPETPGTPGTRPSTP